MRFRVIEWSARMSCIEWFRYLILAGRAKHSLDWVDGSRYRFNWRVFKGRVRMIRKSRARGILYPKRMILVRVAPRNTRGCP